MGFRDDIPASLQAIVQDGLLDRIYENALVPLFLYDRLAELKPWGGQMGSQAIMTRAGLMPVSTTPITGSDATASAYGFEQYSVKMDQWGNSIDTNMLLSAQALASKFIEDNKTLGINAAQTLNEVAQQSLYGAYGEGTTYVTTASTTSTALIVGDATGFANAVVDLPTTNSNPATGLTGEAVPTLAPVSSSGALPIAVGGVANTVTGVDIATNTLTLGTAISATVGQAVVSSIAPVQYRPNGRASSASLVAGDIATLALFQSAVTRLRTQSVPTVGGAYTAHVSPQTIDELFQDPAFQRVYTGRSDSSAYTNFHVGDSVGDGAEFMGRFAGIDWIMNTVTPTATNASGVEFYRPIVCGQGSLIKAPFDRMGDLLADLNAGSTVQIDMIGGVARVLRSPLDRLGQVLSSTWSWVGGYTVGTDLLTGDSAAYKRAVVVEHA